MPKRACPFDDHLRPQFKVHVGDKEVDAGVYKEERMKKVYDKTLNMLKDGSRMFTLKLKPSDDISNDLPSPKIMSNKMVDQERLKQTVLNDKLQLKTVKKLTEKVHSDLCGCCRVIDKDLTTKCQYCDQVLCNFCLSECVKCSGTFCQNCYFNVYDREEYSVCLSCYP